MFVRVVFVHVVSELVVFALGVSECAVFEWVLVAYREGSALVRGQMAQEAVVPVVASGMVGHMGNRRAPWDAQAPFVPSVADKAAKLVAVEPTCDEVAPEVALQARLEREERRGARYGPKV